ncbi:MAG: PIN domain-containing protein [Peptococcaceae bacterium]|jgi:predicted nucleic acid-binding protein|nr:PIN domain-containing protein [Peptococcaceae bacterium]
MVYALDTNIIISYLRNMPNVRRNFNNAVMRGDDLVIPKVVNYEVRRGFRILYAPKKEAAYKVLTEPEGCCDVSEMDVCSWERAEQVYADIYRKGLTIGEMDILIAAFCLENNCTLVTHNIRHFECIDGLQIEDWTEFS